MSNYEPTGRTRFREWKGKLVLQIEVKGWYIDNAGGMVDTVDEVRWRDAKVEDLTLDVLKG